MSPAQKRSALSFDSRTVPPPTAKRLLREDGQRPIIRINEGYKNDRMSEPSRSPSIRQLHNVLSVFDTGSLAAAANQVGREPSTLSQQIAQIETLLRVRLFDRATYGLVPTASGRILETAIRPALAQLSCAILRASRGLTRPAVDISIAARAAPAGSLMRELLDEMVTRKLHALMLHISSLSISAPPPDDGLLLEPGVPRTGALVVRDRWVLVGPPSAGIDLPEFPAAWSAAAAAAVRSLGGRAGRSGLPLERLDRLPRPLRSRLLIPSLAIPGWLRCSPEQKALLQPDMAPPCWTLSHTISPSKITRALAQQLRRELANRVGRPSLKGPQLGPLPRFEREQLECVAAAAQTGSVTRAAALLGIAQPAATMRLRQAEQAVGRQLFERTPSGLSALPPGAYLADAAASFLDGLAQLRSQLASLHEPRGELRVGVVSPLGDGSLLAEALARATEAWIQRYQDRKLVLVEAGADEL
ncbi:MAG: LysR family transcriptional regulator, partial [Hyphomicrobiales bacterium]|nr:LysR family transcriptional regulator [Hyphomicrobiales bacterium]